MNLNMTEIKIWGIFLKNPERGEPDALVAQAFQDPRKPKHYIDELCQRKIAYLSKKNNRFKGEYYYRVLNDEEVDPAYEGILQPYIVL